MVNVLRWAGVCLALTALAGCFGNTRYKELRTVASRPPSELAGERRGPSSLSGLTGRAPKVGSLQVLEASEELVLEELLRSVLERNPSMASMQRAYQAAVSRYPQVTALDDPMFSYGFAPKTIDSDRVDFGQRIELSQRFPFPGKLRLRGEATLEEAEAARSDFDTARDSLVEEAKRAYFDYYYAFRAIGINDVNLTLLGEFQRIAETKYAAGTASKQDALQAEVERYHLEHRGIVLERLRKFARARINTLLHRSPELELPPPPPAVEQPGERLEVSALREQAVNSRPELQALVHRLRAKQAHLELARKEYYPDFTVMGAYNSIWQNDDQRLLVGAGLNIPLQFGRRRAAESEALARVEELEARLAEGVDKVALEVTDAYDKLVESEHVVTLYRSKVIPSAKENLEAAKSGYESGKVDFLALITAEKNLMLVELEYEQALTAYHQRSATLERVVGGKNVGGNDHD